MSAPAAPAAPNAGGPAILVVPDGPVLATSPALTFEDLFRHDGTTPTAAADTAAAFTAGGTSCAALTDALGRTSGADPVPIVMLTADGSLLLHGMRKPPSPSFGIEGTGFVAFVGDVADNQIPQVIS